MTATSAYDVTTAAVAPPLTGEELDRRRACHPLAVAMPQLRTLLLDALENACHVVGIGDATGRLLWIEGDALAQQAAGEFGFLPGAAWSGKPDDRVAERLGLARLACVAAPIHDPHGGNALGVVELAGPAGRIRQASPALARVAAGAVEAQLQAVYARRDARALDLAHRRVDPHGRVAVISPTGRLMGHGLGYRTVTPPTAPGRLRIGRSVLDAEPMEEAPGYWLLRDHHDRQDARWTRRSAVVTTGAQEIALQLLGRSETPLLLDGEGVDVSPRQIEISALLALHPEGLDTTSLREHLYGELDVADVTIRSELSRLRRLLGDAIAARPYRFATRVGTDVERVEESLRSGRLSAAVQTYVGPVLPASDAPAIVELRDRLHRRLRAALLAGDDVEALSQWLGSPHGACDAAVARRVTLLAERSDPAYATAVRIVERALARR